MRMRLVNMAVTVDNVIQVAQLSLIKQVIDIVIQLILLPPTQNHAIKIAIARMLSIVLRAVLKYKTELCKM